MISKASLFLELATPDNQGFSRKVKVAEFVGIYEGLKLGNGGSWCRHDSRLAKQYNVVRHQIKRTIVSVELQGFNKNPVARSVKSIIKKEIKQNKCVILYTSNPETDHKDGRLDNPRLTDINKQLKDDFQPLSKAANNAKRQHCKNCKKTGKRFDATLIGYTKSQIKGNGIYRGTCVGCYWYDPVAFRKAFTCK